LIGELRAELRQLVRIQKVEGAEAVLLSPTQAYFLRENLKLRLLNARIALLTARRSRLPQRPRCGGSLTRALRRQPVPGRPP